MLEWAELWRKTGQRGLLTTSHKRLNKRLLESHNSWGAGSPCPHKRYQSPHKLSSCATFTLNSHCASAATGKKVLNLCMQGRFGSDQLFETL